MCDLFLLCSCVWQVMCILALLMVDIWFFRRFDLSFCTRAPGYKGATENAGVENAIRAKLQGWKMQE